MSGLFFTIPVFHTYIFLFRRHNRLFIVSVEKRDQVDLFIRFNPDGTAMLACDDMYLLRKAFIKPRHM